MAIGQHRVDPPRQLVRGGGRRLGFVHPRPRAEVVRTQCRLAAAQRQTVSLAGVDGALQSSAPSRRAHSR